MRGRKRDTTRGPEEPTSICVKTKTRDRILGHGNMSDSFDTVLNRLLDVYDEVIKTGTGANGKDLYSHTMSLK